jgi:hypothetical protein
MTAIYGFSLAVVLLLCATTAKADPTRPEADLTAVVAVPVGETKPLPKLSLIRSQGRQFQALIDGVLVKNGDKVGAYQVQQISAGQVILRQGDQRLLLNLFKTTTK